MKSILNCFSLLILCSCVAFAQDRTLDPRALDPDKIRNDDVYLNTTILSESLYQAYYDSTEKIFRYFPYSFTDSSGFSESWGNVTALFVNSDKSFYEEHWQVYLEYGKSSKSLNFKDLNGKGFFSFSGISNNELKKFADFSVYPSGRIFKNTTLVIQSDPDSTKLFSLDLVNSKQTLLLSTAGKLQNGILIDGEKKYLVASLSGSKFIFLDLVSNESIVFDGIALNCGYKVIKVNNKLFVFAEKPYENVKPDAVLYTVDLDSRKLVSTETIKGLQYLPDNLVVTNSMKYLVAAKKGSVKLYSLPDFSFLAQVISPQLLKECIIVDSMDVAFMKFNKNISERVKADIAKYEKEGYSVRGWDPDFNMNKDYVYKYMMYCSGGGTPTLVYDVFTNLGNSSSQIISSKTENVKPVERFVQENIVRFEVDVTTTNGFYGKVETEFHADPGTLASYYNFHRPFERILMVKKKTGKETNVLVEEMPREMIVKRAESTDNESTLKKKSAPAGKIECPACGGWGEKAGYNSKKCSSCNGGKVRCTICGGGGRVYTRDRSRSEYCQYCHGAGSTSCYSCGGKGSISTTSNSTCKSCNGTGYISAGAPKK